MNFKWSYIILLMLLFLCATVCVSATETNNTYDVTTSDASCENLNEEISEDIKNGYLSCTNDSDIQASGEGTFSQLNSEISSHTGSIKLNKDYKFNPTSDKSITIAKNIIIDGNGHTIDGSNRVRCININANLKVTLKNLTIMNGYSTAKGAGIRTGDNVDLLLINCVFKNNKVYNANGAALTSGLYSNIKIHNSYFENNTSIRESNKSWGEFKAGMGSAIYAISGTNLTISQSRFTSNNAYLSTILLVSFYGDKILKTSNLNVDNCYFNNNTSNSHGVIYLDEFGQGIIANSTFIHNKSPGGGSILILDSCHYAIVKNCSFIENIGNTGGAIRMSRYNSTSFCNAEIYDCKFINNRGSYGGAINLVTGSTLKLYNSTFINNVATNNGGAIYTQESSTLSVYNSSFTNNKAAGGGAIYCSKSALNIYDSTFDNNKADSSGGAIRITSGGNCKLNINNSTFNSNTAKANGGAIYSTVKTTIKSSYFNSNTGISGGAICMANSQNSKLNCYNSSFNTNKDNSGGSAIYSNVESFNRIIIQKSDFENDKIWIKKDDCKIVIPYLTFTVSNVVYPDKLDINVKSNVSGTYIIKVGNKEQTVKLNANTAKTVRFEGLSAGEYNVEMIYTETTNYNNILKKASVKILKASSKVTINPVGNHNYGQNFDIGFNVVNRTSVTYTVKSKSGKIAVANTKCNSNTISIPVLNVGEYVISVANSENENYTGFVASAAFTILKVTPSINVNTVNVNYPNDVVVNVHSDIDGTYIVKVGDNSQPVDLKANTPKQARFTDLDAGNYNVSVSCIETVNYYSVFKNTPVKILKASSEVSINTIGNHEYGKGFDVNFHVVNPTTMTYIVKSKSGNVVVANTSTSNLNKITIPVLNTGEYIITIANSGNKNYAGDVDSASFTILKTTPTINVNTVNVNYPNDVVVNVQSDIDGTYIVKVGDNSQPVDLKANTPKQARFTGLDAGNYNVSVSYIETVNYNAILKNTPVNILKASSKVSINTIGNHEYGKGFDVNFHVVNPTTVTYIVKSKRGNVVVANTSTSNLNKITIPVLNAGEYIITIANSGNKNYAGDVDSASFTILKTTPTINVNTVNVNYPNDITVNIISNIDGTYIVKIANKTQNVNLKANTPKQVRFTDLNAGNYNVSVSYIETVNYNAVLKNTPVNILKASSKVSINTIGNHEYGKGFDVNFHVVNHTGVSYIVKPKNGSVVVNATADSLNKISIPILDAGEYIVTVFNCENENYTGDEASVNFTILKVTPNITVSVSDVGYPGNVIINVKYDVTGSYTVRVGKVSKTVDLVENKQSKVVFNGLNPGSYDVFVGYDGNINYNSVLKNTIVKVFKADSSVVINPISNVTYNNPTSIEFNIINRTNVTYIVKSISGEIVVKNTTVSGNSADISNLAVGNYIITIANAENDCYNGYEQSKEFTISKATNNVEVNVVNTLLPDSVAVNIKADVDGVYNVSFGEFSVCVNVESGEGFAKIDLPMGIDYITTTSFADTQNYTLNIKETKLNVSKRVNNIKIEVDSVTYPNNITVKVTAEIAGTYIVDINGSEINISIKENNGCGLKTVHLIPGNYTAKVINSTSNFYESNITECNFTVFKGLNIVKVFVEDVECGYCTDIYVTASVKGNYTININGSDVLVEVINDGSTGVITTDKFTKAGEYYANITSKLEYYDETFINCVFTVLNNIRIFVEVSDNVSVGNPVFISVLMDKLINGSVNIKVDDTNHIVDVVDGSANYTICDACEGMHNIVVLYLDDDNNVIKSAKANFTVKNNEGIVIDPDVAFSYLNINDTPVFSINLPANAMGNLTILVDGKYYNSVSLVDGKANVNISNLSNSAHDITMLYSGDYNYPCMNKTFNVSVLKPDYRPVKITPFFKFLKVKKHTLKHFNCAKIVKVILKTKKGKKLGKVKVTFKFNKKSLKKIKAKNKKGKKLLKKLKKGYTVRTNIKGVFTLKLKNKYLTFKKGKYAFTVTFKGNNIYNKATKKGKIKIK